MIADEFSARYVTADEARHDLSSFFDALHDRSTEWQRELQRQQNLRLHAVSKPTAGLQKIENALGKKRALDGSHTQRADSSSMVAAKAANAPIQTDMRVAAVVTKLETDEASLVSHGCPDHCMYDILNLT